MNMYDKLGSLLNETLEAGAVKFVRMEAPADETDKQESFNQASSDQEQSETYQHAEQSPQEQKSDQDKKSTKTEKADRTQKTTAKRLYVYKKLSPELEHAYKVLDVPFYATKEEIKKAYKEKLLYYHPDKHSDNAVIEKVATKKTSEIILAYNLLDDFLNK